jgi:hypothetical protein
MNENGDQLNLRTMAADTLKAIAKADIQVSPDDLAILQRCAAGEDVDLVKLAEAHGAAGERMAKAANARNERQK